MITLKQLEEVEAQLRGGNVAFVREFLRNLSQSEISNSLILRVSQLTRRVDLPSKGLLLLRDRVLDLPSSREPDARELCEYAACLIKIGAHAEALRVLHKVDLENAPEALKFTAFAYIHQWDYSSAIPCLESYISKLDPDSYEHLVGSMNLAASYVVEERTSDAAAILEQIREHADRGKHTLMLGNCFELIAQVEIQKGNFDLAEEYLDLAWDQLKTAHPRYQLYIEKVRAWIALGKNQNDVAGLETLRSIRKKAIASNEWEVIRDCDLHESVARQDSSMFLHLYFGTPYASYRERMLRKSNGTFEIPSSYVIGNGNLTNVLDLESGTLNGNVLLKPGQALHRLSAALFQDFYAPSGVPQLFAKVFENEQFHPVSSPLRIQQLILRLRAKFAGAKLKVEIESLQPGYKVGLYNSEDFALKISANREVRIDLFQIIQQRFATESFKLRDLMEFAKLPHTTLYRQLRELVDSGKITSVGSAKNTRYQVNCVSKRDAS